MGMRLRPDEEDILEMSSNQDHDSELRTDTTAEEITYDYRPQLKRDLEEYKKRNPNWTGVILPRSPWKYASVNGSYISNRDLKTLVAGPRNMIYPNITDPIERLKMMSSIHTAEEEERAKEQDLKQIRELEKAVKAYGEAQKARQAYMAKQGMRNKIKGQFNFTRHGNVSTLSGSGWGNQDGPPTRAKFSFPSGLALDPSGYYLYIADSGNHAIRKVLTSTGYVKTYAGAHKGKGYRDGSADEAKFNNPKGVCVCKRTGDVLVADFGNNVIRRITPNREVFTLAGNETKARSPGPSIDGFARSASFKGPGDVKLLEDGRILVLESGAGKIRKIYKHRGESLLWNGRMDDPSTIPKFWRSSKFGYVERVKSFQGRGNVVKLWCINAMDVLFIQERISHHRPKIGTIKPEIHVFDPARNPYILEELQRTAPIREDVPIGASKEYKRQSEERYRREVDKWFRSFGKEWNRQMQPYLHRDDQYKIMELPDFVPARFLPHDGKLPKKNYTDKYLNPFGSQNWWTTDEYMLGMNTRTRSEVWIVNAGKYRHLQLRQRSKLAANASDPKLHIDHRHCGSHKGLTPPPSANPYVSVKNISSSEAALFQTLITKPWTEYEVNVTLLQARRGEQISEWDGCKLPFPDKAVLKKASVYVIDRFYESRDKVRPRRLLAEVFPTKLDKWHTVTLRFLAKSDRTTLVLMNRNYQTTYFNGASVLEVFHEEDQSLAVETIAGSHVSQRNQLLGLHQDGLAREATFDFPLGFDFDPVTGDVLVTDGDKPNCIGAGHMIRKVSKGHAISPAQMEKYTVAKRERIRQGQLDVGRKLSFVSTFAGKRFPGHADGSVREAMFACPLGIAIDYDSSAIISDAENGCIRRIDENGQVTTIAGIEGLNRAPFLLATSLLTIFGLSPAKTSFLSPSPKAMSSRSQAFLPALWKALSSRLSPYSPWLSTHVDGIGASARFNYPSGLAISPNGRTIYVADTMNNRIRKIDALDPDESDTSPQVMKPFIRSEFVDAAAKIYSTQVKFEEATFLNFTGTLYSDETCRENNVTTNFNILGAILDSFEEKRSWKDEDSKIGRERVAKLLDRIFKEENMRNKAYGGEYNAPDPMEKVRKERKIETFIPSLKPGRLLANDSDDAFWAARREEVLRRQALVRSLSFSDE
eukprot:CAMPEP_0114486312 /NCGR_PEP_ID=MMETSP0109-20121206/148_1 /TAXON_ID=29199 /ORGANISM="Chlorarachnion reptans, Strain CCCM449" /LENGTH=1155 /DNA_ID=CAMNT_0001662467 /DNA_START=533 /DNA_END=4000 /DNA_ORIENTATION=-